MWILRTSSNAECATFRLLPGAVKTLGRATRADFILDAALVSRLHCRFTVRASGELEVEDLQSTNGTYVNEKRVRKAPLSQVDLVRIGRVKLKVAKS
jgi:pSer/pThr/pTyr-binding forkhead associated (FHA) protein